jgi:hypothetical protein
MAKMNQMVNLYNLLSASGDKGVDRTQAAKILGVKEGSVPVYFYWLKKNFKAEIEVKKQGRQILSYTLTNPDVVKVAVSNIGKKSSTPLVKNVKAPKVVKTTKVKKTATISDSGEVSIPDADPNVSEISDREFSDIKSALGID